MLARGTRLSCVFAKNSQRAPSDGVLLADLEPRSRKNLLLLMTSIDQQDSIIILDLVRDDLRRSSCVGSD